MLVMREKKIKQVTIEFYPRDMRDLGYRDILEGIDRVTVLSPISLMPEKTALLLVIQGENTDISKRWESYELIEKVIEMGDVKVGKMYMVLGKEEPWFFSMLQTIMDEMRVFLNWPIILEPERIEMKWIGYLEDIRKVMILFEEFQMKETIRSIVDYDPSRTGPMEGLTSKQFEYLMYAYKKGFYDDKRGATINDLAAEKGISPPTYMLTLRRAMKNLIKGSIDG